MKGYLLDTNIVTQLVKQNPLFVQKVYALQIARQPIYISVMTYYEIYRGLIAVNATRKLQIFEMIIKKYQLLPLDHINLLRIAGNIYADLKQRGRIIQDADILIAATGIYYNLIVVSNDSDLQRITGLNWENWLS
jgi:tRNA(fMet)-specific endonuclease VapC